MVNTFKFFVGGTVGLRTAATATVADYTNQLLRASFDKRFLDDYSFDATIEGVNQSDTYIQMEQDVFFVIYDDSNYWLLMKGIITNIEWTSKKRVRISGTQCMRSSSGSKVLFNRGSTPELTNESELSLDQLLDFENSVKWYGDGESIWENDGKPTAEGYSKGRER